MIVSLLTYTIIVIVNNGWGLYPVFFGDIAAMKWPGQFNIDLTCLLVFSALWTSWRYNFSKLGYLLGFFAFFGGTIFLAPYLLYLSVTTKGGMKEILLGKERSHQ